MTKRATWVLFNTTWFLLTYYGIAEGVEGAENLSYFIAWFTIILNLIVFTAYSVSENITKPERSVPKEVNIAFDVFMASIYIWFGALGTGAFLVITLVCHESMYLGRLTVEKSSE